MLNLAVDSDMHDSAIGLPWKSESIRVFCRFIVDETFQYHFAIIFTKLLMNFDSICSKLSEEARGMHLFYTIILL